MCICTHNCCAVCTWHILMQAVQLQIKRGHQSTSPEILSDFCDGLHYKNHTMLKSPSCLQIMLYYDDLEVCNPLGSSRTKHKLGMLCKV